MPLPRHSAKALIVDFGKTTAGFLRLRIEGEGVVDVALATGPVIDGLRPVARLGVPAGEDWEDGDLRAFRYAKFEVRRTDVSEAEAIEVSLRFGCYPAEYRGHFFCSDDILNRIWFSAAYTVQLGMLPIGISRACREEYLSEEDRSAGCSSVSRAEYLVGERPGARSDPQTCDAWGDALTALYAFGAGDAVKNLLLISADGDAGAAVSVGPPSRSVAEARCWWLALLDRYHMLTDDSSFVRELNHAVQRIARRLRSEIETGDGFEMVLERRCSGAVTPTATQCLAAGALRAASRLMRLAGDTDESARCHEAAERLDARIRSELWDGTNSCFRERPGSTAACGETHSLSVLFHTATSDMAQSAMAFVERHLWTPFGTRATDVADSSSDPIRGADPVILPSAVGVETEARFELGDHDRAMQLIRACWGNMVRAGSIAFPGAVNGRDGSLVSATRDTGTTSDPNTGNVENCISSGSVAYLLQAFVLGVRPVEPGFRRFVIAPRLGHLAFARGAVATPLGSSIEASFVRIGSRLRCQVKVPIGAVAILRLDGGSPVVAPAPRELCPGYHEFEYAIAPDLQSTDDTLG